MSDERSDGERFEDGVRDEIRDAEYAAAMAVALQISKTPEVTTAERMRMIARRSLRAGSVIDDMDRDGLLKEKPAGDARVWMDHLVRTVSFDPSAVSDLPIRTDEDGRFLFDLDDYAVRMAFPDVVPFQRGTGEGEATVHVDESHATIMARLYSLATATEIVPFRDAEYAGRAERFDTSNSYGLTRRYYCECVRDIAVCKFFWTAVGEENDLPPPHTDQSNVETVENQIRRVCLSRDVVDGVLDGWWFNMDEFANGTELDWMTHIATSLRAYLPALRVDMRAAAGVTSVGPTLNVRSLRGWSLHIHWEDPQTSYNTEIAPCAFHEVLQSYVVGSVDSLFLKDSAEMEDWTRSMAFAPTPRHLAYEEAFPDAEDDATAPSLLEKLGIACVWACENGSERKWDDDLLTAFAFSTKIPRTGRRHVSMSKYVKSLHPGLELRQDRDASTRTVTVLTFDLESVEHGFELTDGELVDDPHLVRLTFSIRPASRKRATSAP